MQRDIAKEAIKQITLKLDFLIKVGVDYLTPARQAKDPFRRRIPEGEPF